RLSSRRHAQHGHRATLVRLQEVADGTEPLELVLSQRRLSKFLNLPPNRTYSRPGALPAMRGDAQHSDNVFRLILSERQLRRCKAIQGRDATVEVGYVKPAL